MDATNLHIPESDPPFPPCSFVRPRGSDRVHWSLADGSLVDLCGGRGRRAVDLPDLADQRQRNRKRHQGSNRG